MTPEESLALALGVLLDRARTCGNAEAERRLVLVMIAWLSYRELEAEE